MTQVPQHGFKSLTEVVDQPLLDYFKERRLSPRFLTEIDMFLNNHIKIARLAPDFANNFNAFSPLQSYKFFIKGYTKPARYQPEVSVVVPPCIVQIRLIQITGPPTARPSHSPGTNYVPCHCV